MGTSIAAKRANTMLCGYLSSIEAKTIGSIQQLGGVTGAFSRPVGPMAQIVRTPEDAFASFMGTEIGFLLVGNCMKPCTRAIPVPKGSSLRSSLPSTRPGRSPAHTEAPGASKRAYRPGYSVAVQGSLEIESKDKKIVSLFVVALQVMALRKRSINRLPVAASL